MKILGPKKEIKGDSCEKFFTNIDKITSHYIKNEIKVKEERNHSQSELDKIINTKTEIKNEETDIPIFKSESTDLMTKIKKEPFD